MFSIIIYNIFFPKQTNFNRKYMGTDILVFYKFFPRTSKKC